MEQYEIQSKVKGLRNYAVPVRGSNVTAYLGVWEDRPHVWVYSLWEAVNTAAGEHEALLALGDLDMSAGGTERPMNITPEQVARVAFLLEVEYGS